MLGWGAGASSKNISPPPYISSKSWEFCHLPRVKSARTKEYELALCGQILTNICVANDDKSPIALSTTFHGSSLFILMTFLGLLPNHDYKQLAFWRYCTWKTLHSIISYFPYMVCFYKDTQPIFYVGFPISTNFIPFEATNNNIKRYQDAGGVTLGRLGVGSRGVRVIQPSSKRCVLRFSNSGSYLASILELCLAVQMDLHCRDMGLL